MRRSILLMASATMALAAACRSTEAGNVPVGGTEVSTLEQERFLKRLSMDLVGDKPDETRLTELVGRLGEGDNAPEVRADIARELMASEAFADTYVADLESRAFGGARADDIYALFCSVFVDIEPECASCVFDPEDPCGCACGTVARLGREQEVILGSAADLEAGASTKAISERYAGSLAFQFNAGTAEGTAAVLFDAFLGRMPEAEEVRNVRAFVLGDSVEGVEGILFLEKGSNYTDMMDIFFGSEVYREGAVAEVFRRYLGREPTAPELSHFAAELDPADPDVRDVIVSVVSSQEYFDQ